MGGLGYDLVMFFVGSTTIFTVLSWCNDPVIGYKHCREQSWEEVLDRHAYSMSAEELLQAKVGAIWRWADTWEDGNLEPREIYRLAQEIGHWLGPRSGLPWGKALIDQDMNEMMDPIHKGVHHHSIGDQVTEQRKAHAIVASAHHKLTGAMIARHDCTPCSRCTLVRAAVDHLGLCMCCPPPWSERLLVYAHQVKRKHALMHKQQRQHYETLCSTLGVEPFPERLMPPNKISPEAVALELKRNHTNCGVDAKSFWLRLRQPCPVPTEVLRDTAVKLYDRHMKRPSDYRELCEHKGARRMMERDAEVAAIRMCIAGTLEGLSLVDENIADTHRLALERWAGEEEALLHFQEEKFQLDEATEEFQWDEDQRGPQLKAFVVKRQKEEERLARVYVSEILELAEGSVESAGAEIFEVMRLPLTRQDMNVCMEFGCG